MEYDPGANRSLIDTTIPTQTVPTRNTTVPVLELVGISKQFGTALALDEVSMSVGPGEIHALLGENGAGKTTLMRIAFGMTDADSGKILVDGRVRHFRSPADAIGSGIGMVHQQFALVSAMSVAENVALGGRGHYDFEVVADCIRSVGERTGLWLEPSAKVSSLNTADRQKLEIIRTFANDARILILDEPTAVLTPRDIGELFEQVVTFAARGGSVVLITHKLNDAVRHAHEVTVLRCGRVVMSGLMASSSLDSLTTAMLGGTIVHAAVTETPSGDTNHVVSPTVLALTDIEIHTERGDSSVIRGTVEIREGEIVGVAALDGAARGLLRTMAGRLEPHSGTVHRPDEIGFVPEDRQREAIIPGLSLTENLGLRGAGNRHGLMQWPALHRRAESIIHEFDVRGCNSNSRVESLSGGNQQRFVVGRELESSPRALILENPTQGLDVQAASSVHQRMRAARNTGTAVVFYSSDIDELVDLADRVLVVVGGRVRSVEPDRETVGRMLLGIDADNSHQ